MGVFLSLSRTDSDQNSRLLWVIASDRPLHCHFFLLRDALSFVASTKYHQNNLVMIVCVAQGQFEFPLELLDLEAIAPQNFVLFVDIGDVLHEGLKVLYGSLDSLSGVLGIVFVIDGPKTILHVIDAHSSLNEEILEFVQSDLDLFGAERIRRRRRRRGKELRSGQAVVDQCRAERIWNRPRGCSRFPGHHGSS